MKSHESLIDFVCGMGGGVVATTAALPLDVARTRLIAQGKHKVGWFIDWLIDWQAYRTMRYAFVQMYKTEGVSSFYRGFIPSVVQVAPFTGFQFMFYKGCVRFWDKFFRQTTPKKTPSTHTSRRKSTSSFEWYYANFVEPLESLVCGAVSGTLAKAAVYPLDMIKKRFQVRGFEHARASFGAVPHYTGLIDCVNTILRTEGFVGEWMQSRQSPRVSVNDGRLLSGLYKGLVPSLYKAAVVSGVGFFVYEQTCRAIYKWKRWHAEHDE